MSGLPKKKLVVCCDGTWLNSNNGTKTTLDPLKNLAAAAGRPIKVDLQPPSNVTRLVRCIQQLDKRDPKRPIQQITYYQSGVGTQNLEDKVLGGGTGFGLDEHIREAYQFIAANYNPHSEPDGDEIFIIGFSRGAFTARSIAAFINDVGLLTPVGLQHFYTIYLDWMNQQVTDWKVPFEDDPFPGHHLKEFNLFDREGKKRYVGKLQKLGMTTPGVRIKACAVWDTVGALGIPRLGVFNQQNHTSLDYAFVDTEVPPAVEHAIHALSLDERRKPFMPTIWELPNPLPHQTLTQVWFAGAHADVGGSYEDSRAADITLTWMAARLEDLGLMFDNLFLLREFYKPEGEEPPLKWGCGPINDPFKGIYLLADSLTRSPMRYLRYDHYTGVPKVPHEYLQKTNERVHSSVRIRYGLKGKTAAGKDYTSDALKGWKCEGVPKDPVDPGSVAALNKVQANIVWRKEGLEMHEEPLSPLEVLVMGHFKPDIMKQFCNIAPPEEGWRLF